ncbi:MAG: PAS domain S-box protein [Steroidobacteraceae bacterium]
MESQEPSDDQMRDTALRNIESILAARQHAERELLAAKEMLELKAIELSRFAAVVESSDDAIITKTLEGIIVTWNQAAERIFGYTEEEVIGKSVTLLMPPEHVNEEPEILSRLRRGERVDHYETIRQHKNGTRLNISLSISPIKDSSGRIVGASKIARDVTRQKRVEAALRSSEERFRIMADSSPALIWMSDADKMHTWFNRPWLEFTGRTLEQERGYGWTENIHADDLKSCMQQYTESFEARVPFRMECRIRRKDGAWRWMVNAAVPLFENQGQDFCGYIGSCLDMTEMRLAANERESLLEAERNARSEAERVGRMKDEFLATLSHELRTPLNAVLGWTVLLQRLPPGSQDHKKGLETIERNARAQANIIEDLLDMSRIISGKVQLDVKPVNLREIVEAAIDTLRPSADAKRLRLNATLDSRIGLVRGDANRLQQVMWNLLTNAAKFTQAGGRINIVMERVNSHVEISVEDSGIGIAPAFLTHVFDRFRQADASITRGQGGLGLGLSIVKHLVELHGGNVRAESAGEGQGTTFTVTLPITSVRSERREQYERPWVQDTNPAAIDLPMLDRVRVLVVDDQPDARELIGRLIIDQRGRAVLAESAGHALDLLGQEPIDILVSDIGMPETDGYELIRRIRALPGSVGRTPAIAVTAYARADDRHRALLAGFQMHLSKPVEPRELIAGIASLTNLPR